MRKMRIRRNYLNPTAEIAPIPPRGSNLKAKIDGLAKKAWGDRSDIVGSSFIMSRKTIEDISTHSDIVREMLKHVRRVAPALSVPMMTSKIVVEPLALAAGQFIEQDGWVTIAVGVNFFDNRSAAIAILCHELCHYILGANGIRELSTLENERTTDAAMFAFGLGDLFMHGYKRAAPSQYRAGHRLGYLNDGEYAFADRYVRWLRTSEDFLSAAKSKERRDDWNWDRSLR